MLPNSSFPPPSSPFPPSPSFTPSTPTPPTSPRRRVGGGGSVVAAAVLAAAIASVSTAGLVYVTAPRTSPAPATAAATAAPSANAALTATSSTTDQTAMIAQAQKSVVTITTSGAASTDPFGRGGSGGGVGSGIIVSADGLILTNAHVVAGGGTLTVQLQDGRQLPGTVVSSDAAKDLAIVRVQATGLTPAQLGKSSAIKVGESVVAIGTPLGEYAESVTAGIISATDRTITVAGDRRGQGTQLSGLLQTDAAINPGNSGGPLIDAAGNVIGVVTAASGAAQGIGFAIPIDEAASMISAASTAA
jgi:S1-C subfamily serine protease